MIVSHRGTVWTLLVSMTGCVRADLLRIASLHPRSTCMHTCILRLMFL